MSELPPRRSLKRWLVTTNHKDVGVMYLVTAMFFLLLGGLFALVFRAHLWESGGTGLLSGAEFNQSVTSHGLIMVFWFLSPFATGFANYVVPLQIGADDLAFPRLNALSYWFYLFSGILFMLAFFQGGSFGGGWTMYAPLNVPTYTLAMEATAGSNMTIIALMMFVMSISFGTVNFMTTIHRMRAEGLGLWNMPLFTWSWLLTVWMMLFAFAALLAALLLLSIDRIFLTQYFATAEGSSLLWGHLFWFFGHPEVYIVFFPALGLMFETFQTFTGRRLVGRKWVIIAMVLVAVQSFLVWMHHMFLTTINLEIKTLYMATTIGISLPFDLMVFALIYTMVKGRVRFTTPFLFNLGALVLFILGGITGVFLGAVVLDYEFRGTYWVVAHFHYVMVSGVTALVGGLYYWWPKITGKMYHEFAGKLHFAAYFIGFNLLYFPMFLTWETPRRVFHYQAGDLIWHQLTTVGAYFFGFSFLIMFVNFAWSLLYGPKAPDNPWKFSRTAEWAIPSPPPLDNWPGRPTYRSGTLEFVDDSTETATDGGEADDPAVATDGGTTVDDTEPDDDDDPTIMTDGGTVIDDEATDGVTEPVATDGGAVTDATMEADRTDDAASTHEEAHVDHASIWPFMLGLSTFIMFVGLSGMTSVVIELLGDQLANNLNEAAISDPAASTDLIVGSGEMRWGYITAFVGGLGLLLYSLFKLGTEQFEAPTMNVAERWPFEGIDTTKFGVWVFLASDVIVFGAAIGAYVFMRLWSGWGTFHTIPNYTWPGLLNTYVLLTSSFTVILALVMAERSNKKGVLATLGATIILGIGFLGIKGWEWAGKFADGDYWFSGLEYSMYYVTTGLHALHVIMGLLIGIFMLYRVYTIDAYLGDNRHLEYFGLYWHFVDIVWVILFPLFYLM
ncbi:heme/copper-type cytochrome/quinol oxidase, subunit 1 [Halovivax ruber XH-70]|uniref:Heme/copper-type cytochrome/quinol oxidase, subunit 1 n=1 Tax=Halovivax ruber (strain DSM 18193 / JCM 13892 / XH-70) TaxID=797302 RepID=L0ICI0_HALRX|nr:cbb3-type cytochrome c oxidase subunit I [Halovivax ruber]AGB16533.1 heme/copper-type cytochrome/quinol oxidase, subunit 1 [Halovivax ruber XH-70]